MRIIVSQLVTLETHESREQEFESLYSEIKIGLIIIIYYGDIIRNFKKIQ
jgi:hypothetical protein